LQGKLDDAVQHGMDMETHADGAIQRELHTVRDLQDERALRKKVEAEVKALKAERTKILESHATALKKRDTEHQAAELQAKGKAFLAGRKAERELQAAEIKRKDTEFETERQNALASAESSAAKRLEEKDKELVRLRKEVRDLKVKVEAGSQKVAELSKATEDTARLEKVFADDKADYDSRLEEKDTEIATIKEEVASLKAKNNLNAEWWHRASEAMRSFPGRLEEEDVEMN
jgi:chromosome segregation ATPase